MKIIAKGSSEEKCKVDVDRLTNRGWTAITPVIKDKSYIGSRYVCVMEKPDEPKFNKSKFNQYCGY